MSRKRGPAAPAIANLVDYAAVAASQLVGIRQASDPNATPFYLSIAGDAHINVRINPLCH
jgi:hypothetical protein